MAAPVLELRDIQKRFGTVIALAGVTVSVNAGEVHCLLGDNGAGKSTLIKTMSGVHKPTSGQILVDGKAVAFTDARHAIDSGIATVFQDLAMIPMMSVTRNFFLGREPKRRVGAMKFFDFETADRIAMEETARMGIRLRGPGQAVGTLSGGERQSVAIARAVYFGARVLILDEPTSALGVRQTANVLSTVHRVRTTGVGVVFITHNVRHAMATGARLSLLNSGHTPAPAGRGDASQEAPPTPPAGGEELVELEASLGGMV